MAKGIRQYVEAKFTKMLPKLQALGGTGFRRQILDDTVAQFDISMASASAAYNYVIQKFRTENPRAVAGLGRTEMGTNVLGSMVRGAAGRAVANANTRRQPQRMLVAGNVTLVKANNGEVVVESIPRKLAQDLIATSGSGRGRAKLVIQEDQEAA